MISIIIPVYNEEDCIEVTLNKLSSLMGDFEVIVSDSNSSDNTISIINGVVHTSSLNIKLIESKANSRARAMNAGANIASGDTLLFLHADTVLPSNALNLINESISAGKIGGAFKVCFSGTKIRYKLVALYSNTRAKIGKMYHGDQAIFIKHDTFKQLGMYKDIPLMEDVSLSLSMKKKGSTELINHCACTSPRRIAANGLIKSIVIYFYLKTLFYLGFSIEHIAKVYNSTKTK